jgi:hypothetical protein
LLLLWPTLWAVWIAARGWPPKAFVLIFVLGTVLMRSAGMRDQRFRRPQVRSARRTDEGSAARRG